MKTPESTNIMDEIYEVIDSSKIHNKKTELKDVRMPIWLLISESAKIAGVNAKTVRRAIQSKKVKYKIVQNRYQVDLASLIEFVYSSSKLKNKLYTNGIGQYITQWRLKN